jgi:hypothetical protein
MEKTGQLTEAVLFRNQDDFGAYSRIYCSDSEYGLLLLIHIPDSYTLNLTSEEAFSNMKCLHEIFGG